MKLTCEKCGRHHPLTDDDVAFFFPRFFCLSCGVRIPFPIDEQEIRKLLASNDRDRRLPDQVVKSAQDTLVRVRRASGSTEGTEGG